ncbi:MAG: hypothetical protein CSH36_14160 [Thalassolituus sp.]|nr:MAG: hypothetical protein CSH36_14160 [Thalassolituus sp.]
MIGELCSIELAVELAGELLSRAASWAALVSELAGLSEDSCFCSISIAESSDGLAIAEVSVLTDWRKDSDAPLAAELAVELAGAPACAAALFQSVLKTEATVVGEDADSPDAEALPCGVAARRNNWLS